jgi:hypothetical protein
MTMEQRYFRCKKCGEWFEAPPLAEYQTVGMSKMEKCTLCGKFAIYQHSEARSSPSGVKTSA